MTCSIVWFRQDLRVADNAALTAAAKRGNPIIALYVLDDESAGEWKIGAASRWWLHYSLEALAADLTKYGIHLTLLRGRADDIVRKLVAEARADAVFWNRCYEPYAVRRDTALKKALVNDGIHVESFNPGLLHEPDRLRTGGGTPFRVFTPFYRALQTQDVPPPLPVPHGLKGHERIKSDDLNDWKLLPTHPDWAGGIEASWQPGEANAKKRFNGFIDHALKGYATGRDHPAEDLTSRLSPHLHHGELSARQIWHALSGEAHGGSTNIEKFRSELGWREFATYCLYHVPTLPDEAMNPRFHDFPYKANEARLKAWQRGRTGYPLIDAGMRQLWETGWMHNRVRLAVASFLTKHLGISWQTGEAWFWDTLVDADLGNNALGWQWVAGSGPDASPYYRIFNPILQSEKFDAEGNYIRRFVPELAKIPSKHIHAPWDAPQDVLEKAGVVMGKTYPMPIVDHAEARATALARYHGQ